MNTNTQEVVKTVAVIRELSGQDACHRVGCSDLQKARKFSDVYYEEVDLATAEANFNEDLGEDAGYDDPWIWSRDVKVYPCALEVNK